MKTKLATTLKHRATELIADLAEKRDTILITHHGRPAAYLMDVETYEGLNRRPEIMEVIARGERAVEEGRVVTHKEAKKRMARWLK